MASLLKKGSKGDEVLQLQGLLNSYGNYGLDTDGIFGDQTYNAVRSFQSDKGLDVDGIVGDQTWGALAAINNAENMANPDQTEPATATTARGTTYNPNEMSGSQADTASLEAGKPSFQQSQALTDALNQLQAQLGQKPATYESPYSEQIRQLYEQATAAREPFQYDPNADPVYQMYADRYRENAQRAMRDTMADAAGLTGGYGNSYAEAAAQQAYDAQMNGLNDVLPELYSAAYGRYQDQGNELLQRLALAQQMDEGEYARWQDQVADYYNQLAALQGLAQTQYNMEYGQYQDALDQYNKELAYYYGKQQDELAQQNYLASLAGSGSSGGSGGGSSGGRSSGSGGSSGSGSKAATTADYKTILSTAKGMMDQDAYNYVTRMVNQGYLSNEQGYRILAVEMGLDMSKLSGGTGSTNLAQLAGQIAATGTTGRSSALATNSGTKTSSASKTSTISSSPASHNASNLTVSGSALADKVTTQSNVSGTGANLATTLAAQAAAEALKKLKK